MSSDIELSDIALSDITLSDITQIFQTKFYPNEYEEVNKSNSLSIFVCKETVDGHFVVYTIEFDTLKIVESKYADIFEKLITLPPIYEYLLEKNLSIDLVSFEKGGLDLFNSEEIKTYFISNGTQFFPNVNFNIIAVENNDNPISYDTDTHKFINVKENPTNEDVYKNLYGLTDTEIRTIDKDFLKKTYNEEDQIFFEYMSVVLNEPDAFGATSESATSGTATSGTATSGTATSGTATSGTAKAKEKEKAEAAKAKAKAKAEATKGEYEKNKGKIDIESLKTSSTTTSTSTSTTFRGIYNYNAQCYLSSVIQLFARIPEFENYLRGLSPNKPFIRSKGIQRREYELQIMINSILIMFACVKSACANPLVGFWPSQAIRKMDQGLQLDKTVYGHFGETDSIIEMFAWPDTFLNFFDQHVTKISLPYFTSRRLFNHEDILKCYFASIASINPCYEFQQMHNVKYNNTYDKDPRETVKTTNYLLVTINRIPTALPRVILDKQTITLLINGYNIQYRLIGAILGSGGHFVFVDYSNFNSPMLFDDSRAIPFNNKSNSYFYTNRFQFVSQLLYEKVVRRGGRKRKTFRVSRRKKLKPL